MELYRFPAVTCYTSSFLRLSFTREGHQWVHGPRLMYSDEETLRDLSFRKKAFISNTWASLHIWQTVPMAKFQPIFLPRFYRLAKSLLHKIRRWIQNIQQLIECGETKEWEKQRRFQCYNFSSKALVGTKSHFKMWDINGFLFVKPSIL